MRNDARLILFLALIYGAVGLIGWGILKLAGML